MSATDRREAPVEAYPDARRGITLGLAAYVTWGFFPLYWALLDQVPSLEVLAHRVAWSVVTVAVLLVVVRRWHAVLTLIRDRRRFVYVTVGALAIAVNWGVFIYAVAAGQVVQVSLGYFVNPLVTVLVGVVVLGERLRRWQWVALAIAGVGVVGLAIEHGGPPWIALSLACSFALYGLAKKKADVGTVEGLGLETFVLAPVALAYLGYVWADGSPAFGTDLTTSLVLAGTGLVTAIPLLLFGAAATRVPLTTIGLLQYAAPILQFVLGLTVFGEQMSPARWAGFVLVWISLTLLSVETVHRRRRTLRESALASAV